MYDGMRPLDPPSWWIRLFEGPQAQVEGTQEEVPLHDRNLAAAPEIR